MLRLGSPYISQRINRLKVRAVTYVDFYTVILRVSQKWHVTASTCYIHLKRPEPAKVFSP